MEDKAKVATVADYACSADAHYVAPGMPRCLCGALERPPVQAIVTRHVVETLDPPQNTQHFSGTESPLARTTRVQGIDWKSVWRDTGFVHITRSPLTTEAQSVVEPETRE